jgi:2,4-dienoyl-CoA reductase-like NADH-dependent reductase (Old Yellow Enzyme family)
MTPDLELLWQPVEIGPLTLRNRIASGPSTLLYAQDNVLSQRHVAYHAERARGGTALIITEEHAAYDGALGAFPDACTAYEERAVPAMAALADALHGHGALGIVQLYGPGASDTGTVVGDRWRPAISASAVTTGAPNVMTRELSVDEIADIVAGHAVSAANVAQAGMDGIELHAAHGWLAGQFLSPLFNRRRDGYGGSARERCRFVLELIEAARAAAPGLALGVQVSVDEHVGTAGIRPADCLEQIDVLAGAGVDYISISTGSRFSTARTIAAMESPDVVLGAHGRAARDVVAGRAKVLLVETIRTVADAARVIAAGAADVAVMTRAHFADPYLVEKARAGRVGETIPCVGENECMIRAFAARPVACLMNPVMGREAHWGPAARRPDRARAPGSVVIAGAGPAGLTAAAALAVRGARVTVLERRDRPGGHVAALGELPGRARWRLAVAAWVAAAQRAGVQLRLGEAADVDIVAALAPDLVLCATGATWRTDGASGLIPGSPPAPWPVRACIPVLDVATAVTRALADPRGLGERVLIADESGEYLPLGLADLISAAGTRIDVVTPHAEPAQWVTGAQDGTEVLARLAAREVTFIPGHAVSDVAGAEVSITERWSDRSRSLGTFDTIVLAQLRIADDGLVRRLRDGGAPARALGDALAPRRTLEVVYEAERIGRELTQ